jgi:gp16 family phage-associated protein
MSPPPASAAACRRPEPATVPAGPVIPEGPNFPQTLESARDWFTEHGVTVAAWAAARGLSAAAVYDALRGRLDGRRGAGHQALVELGIKPRPPAAPADSPDSRL